MAIFWENVLRYPRFFVSTMIGLVSIILAPIIYLYKESPNKVITIFFVLLLVGLLIFTLKTMIEF
uniref:Ycf33 n=1 Tax=Chattonella marina TaxID=90936 RepID=UPI002114D760|nr:Ycf33 [Chattonella marina]UTE94822.1 Ycf33 [Chattonella marina]